MATWTVVEDVREEINVPQRSVELIFDANVLLSESEGHTESRDALLRRRRDAGKRLYTEPRAPLPLHQRIHQVASVVLILHRLSESIVRVIENKKHPVDFFTSLASCVADVLAETRQVGKRARADEAEAANALVLPVRRRLQRLKRPQQGQGQAGSEGREVCNGTPRTGSATRCRTSDRTFRSWL